MMAAAVCWEMCDEGWCYDNCNACKDCYQEEDGSWNCPPECTQECGERCSDCAECHMAMDPCMAACDFGWCENNCGICREVCDMNGCGEECP